MHRGAESVYDEVVDLPQEPITLGALMVRRRQGKFRIHYNQRDSRRIERCSWWRLYSTPEASPPLNAIVAGAYSAPLYV